MVGKEDGVEVEDGASDTMVTEGMGKIVGASAINSPAKQVMVTKQNWPWGHSSPTGQFTARSQLSSTVSGAYPQNFR